MWLETDRLLLRPVEYMDVDQLVALWADPVATRFVGGPRDAASMRDALDEQAEQPPAGAFGMWPIAEKASGRIAGTAGLVERELDGATEVELACVLVRQARDRGYEAEIGEALLRLALDVLELPRVIALIDPEDDACGRAVTELGMRKQQQLKQPNGDVRHLWVADKGLSASQGEGVGSP